MRGVDASELHQLNRTLRALSKSSQAMLRSTDEPAFLEQVCRVVVEDCGHAMVWIGFAEDDPGKTVRPAAHAGFEKGYLETLHVTWADTERGRGPTGTAIRTGRPSACTNMLTDPRFAPWREDAIKRGYASSIVFPLLADGTPFGAITIYSRDPNPFSEDERKLLAELADDLAYGVTALRSRAAHKRAEDALRESEERLRLTLKYAAAGTWEWNVLSDEVTWSPESFDLYGVDRGDTLDYARWERCLHPDDVALATAALRAAVEGRVPEYHAEFRVQHPALGVRWILAVGQVERAYDGTALRLLGLNLDITERKRAEEEAREADRGKTEFLAVLSHELRNPLAPIRNSVYILEHTDPTGEQGARARGVIHRQTEHLTRLVDDLLDVTRISRGKVELKRSRTDLREVVSRAADDYRSAMEDRGITFRAAFPEAEVWADADATRITQVVGNLLHNAAKFSRRGDEVTLSLHAADDEAEISVRDTGAGIDPALLPRIFDAFVQGERTVARSEGGLGLGLALVKGITELHGGRVRGESAGIGKGAAFVVRLPALAATPIQERLHPAAPRTRGGRRVLVVDDNRDGAESLAEIVELLGHVADVAFDGPSALEKASANRPHVVLCDIGLPGMSGYEVAKALRASGANQMQLIALSGYAQAEDVKRALEAGFDSHLAKPCDPVWIGRLLG